jgi:hypothetical protein
VTSVNEINNTVGPWHHLRAIRRGSSGNAKCGAAVNVIAILIDPIKSSTSGLGS